ncbi:MAG TPA: YihY/virulence factor BrkB family protein [Stellaceae bacterium]|nr:YihY/virulence factor BrkB family protein [Stellaceae bacterium]
MTEAIQTSNARPRLRARVSRWGCILTNVWNEIARDHVSVMAAGVGFYAFLSIFPAMSAIISVYGLVGDPRVIERQLANLTDILPPAALKLLSTELHALIAAPQAGLGIGLIVSLLVTLWSAMYGTTTLMQALTVAENEEERRGTVRFYAQAAALTIGIGLFGVISLLLVAVVPAIIDMLPFPAAWRSGIALIRWPLLACFAYVALALVYRFAPSREAPQWHWVAPGTIAAVALWLLGSAGFSYYVSEFSSYNKTYGTLGAVVVLMMWFYYTAYIILVGAELNTEHERASATAE